MTQTLTASHWAVAAQRRSGLARLIAPIEPEAFAAEYWERHPLILRRGDSSTYAWLLTLSDADAILNETALDASQLRIVADGQVTPMAQVVAEQPGGTDQAAEALYDRYRKGGTLNLTFIHERWEPLGELCRSLSAELCARVHANAYLTPPQARGLKTHFDTHDVFVVQIHGTKHWRIYEPPVALPLPSHHYDPAEAAPGEPSREFDLEPGDLLYLPRGTLHDAAAQTGASLHITIGVSPVLWSDLVQEAIGEAFENDVRYREALPIGFALDSGSLDSCRARLRQLLADLGQVAVDEAITAAARRVSLNRAPSLRGHLLDLEALPSVSPTTLLRPRPGLLWALSHDPTGTRLEFHGKIVRFPARVHDELRFVTGRSVFTARDLPGPLDEAGRLVLITTLLREGFLTVLPTPLKEESSWTSAPTH